MANKVRVEITGDNTDLKKAFYDSEKTIKTSSRNMTDEIRNASIAMGGAFASIGTALLVKDVIMLADTYTNLNSRLKLVTDSSEQLAILQDELFQISQETGTSYEVNAKSYAKLALSLQEVNVSQEEMLEISSLVNKSLIVSGASTQEIASFTLQFTQAMGSGVLQGQEFLAMMESNSYFGARLAKALDTDIAGLREMSKAGKLTTDVLREAFPKMAAEVDAAFDQMPVTIGRAMTEMKNSFAQVVSEANIATGGTSAIATAIEGISNTIQTNKGDIIGFYEDVVEVTTSTYDIAKKFEEYGGPSFGEWGIIGFALLRGGPQAAALTGALVTLNTQLEHFDLNLGNLATSGKEFYDTMGRLLDGETSSYFDETGKYIGSAVDELGDVNKELEHYRGKLKEIQDLEGWIKTLNDMAGGAEDVVYYTAKIEELLAKRDSLQVLQDKKDLMVEMGNAIEDTYTEQGELAEEAVEGEKKVVKAIRLTTDERYTALQMSKKVAKEEQKDRETAEKEAKKLAKMQSDAYRDMYGEMTGFSKKALQAEQKSLEERAIAYKSYGVDVEVVNEWLKQKNKDLLDTYDRKYGDFFDGVRLGYEDLIENQITWAEAGIDIFDTFADGATNALSSNLFDIVKLDFDDLGSAWGDLWDSMLQKFVDILAQMAVEWAASQISDAFAGWEIFHDGAWDIKKDEVPAILQEGEMVIPREHAEYIRDTIGTSSFDGLLEGISSPGLSEFDSTFGDHMTGAYGKKAVTGAALMATGNLGPSDFISGMLSTNFAVSAASSSLAKSGLDAMGFNTGWTDAGYMFGQIATMVALGLTGPVGAMVGALGGFLGGQLGDFLGDALDARTMESIRDQYESNYGTYEGRSKFDSDWGEVASILKDTGNLGGFAGLGIGNPGSYGGSNDAPGTYSSTDGVEADPTNYDTDYGSPNDGLDTVEGPGMGGEDSYWSGPGGDGQGADGSDSVGSYDGGTSMSDYGGGDDGGGQGADGYRYGGISYGPDSGHMELLHGVEAVVPLQNGSIPVDISSAGNAETLAEIRRLVSAMEKNNEYLYQITKNTLDSKDLLDTFDVRGILQRAA